jgi:hypothetical protein
MTARRAVAAADLAASSTKCAESFVDNTGPLLAALTIMQIKVKMVKWIAGSVLVATTAGVLSGCYVESRPRHYYARPHARPVVILR